MSFKSYALKYLPTFSSCTYMLTYLNHTTKHCQHNFAFIQRIFMPPSVVPLLKYKLTWAAGETPCAHAQKKYTVIGCPFCTVNTWYNRHSWASVFRHPASQSGIVAFRYRTGIHFRYRTGIHLFRYRTVRHSGI